MTSKKAGLKRRLSFTGFIYLIFFVIILFVQVTSFARTDDNKNNIKNENSQEEILKHRAQLKEEIKKNKTDIELKTDSDLTDHSSFLEKKLEILQKIDLIYEQQLSQIKQYSDLKQSMSQLQDKLSNLKSKEIPYKAPYSFLLLDELKEKLALLEDQADTIKVAVKTVEDSLQAAKDKMETMEQNRRRIKDDLKAKDKEEATSNDLTLARLSSRLAEERIKHLKITLQNEKTKESIHQLKFETLTQEITLVSPLVQFTQKELQDQIFKIEKNSISLKYRLKKVRTREELTHSRWANAKKQLDMVFSPDEREKKEKEVLVWRTWTDTYHLEVEVLSKNLKNLDDLKKIWRSRYELFHKIDSFDPAAWKKKSISTLEQMGMAKRLLIARHSDCRNEIPSLEKKLKSAKEASKITWFVEEQLKAFKKQGSIFTKGLERINSTQRAYQKMLGEIEKKEKYKSIKEKLSDLWATVYRIWRYEITSVEDYPITVGKIIIALILLTIGFLLSQHLTAQIGKQLFSRFGMDEAATIAFQKILHYLFLIMIVLFVLNMVRIPLTFFTVIGGALAIGVGFGSQNIVNNFLSGLILLIERPVKIGDIVDVENIQGTVEWVGGRSTKIRTFDNLRLVVPNSTLLQNKVINWSLSDDIVRREIVLGIAYGSDVKKAESLILKAVSGHKLVEKDPAPIVLFNDFGDSALIFRTLLWIKMSKVGMAHYYIIQVESDIRFSIDELFRQNNIVIAFPQQDTHLDTLKPLEIRLKREKENNDT
ncbi:MAG: mechanosensitive ion channel [Thermodesulfobacteriota bacterium]|nr:mechanosensitive ion channel [Thermodesulfobacteriota bacterium]